MADGSRIMKPQLTSVLLRDLVILAATMLPDEKAQWEAVTGEAFDADQCARAMSRFTGPSYCLLDGDGNPLVVAGFEEVRPKVWQAWMAGTPEAWRTQWKRITRECKRVGDALLASGAAHRLQIYALPERGAALRWYEALGYRFEGRLAQFFADGSDAVCYVRTR